MGKPLLVIPYLVGPSLQALELDLGRIYDPRGLAECLHMLAMRCNQLKRIVLLNRDNEYLAAPIASFLSSSPLPELREFLYDAPTHLDTFTVLGSSSTLEDTCVNDGLIRTPVGLSPNFPTTHSFFQSVKNLKITCHDFSGVCKILDTIVPAIISLLSVKHKHKSVNADVLSQFFLSLQVFRTLRIFILDSDTRQRRPDWSPRLGLTSSFLQPLLSLENLEEVYIRPRLQVLLDDSFMQRLAASWPYLKCFEIDPRYTLSNKQKPTLLSLFSFASHCRRLDDLRLPLNLKVDIWGKRGKRELETFQEAGLNLRSLQIIAAEVFPRDNTQRIADLIGRVFPRLSDFELDVRRWDGEQECHCYAELREAIGRIISTAGISKSESFTYVAAERLSSADNRER